jgi:hypothetical protein
MYDMITITGQTWQGLALSASNLESASLAVYAHFKGAYRFGWRNCV